MLLIIHRVSKLHYSVRIVIKFVSKYFEKKNVQSLEVIKAIEDAVGEGGQLVLA